MLEKNKWPLAVVISSFAVLQLIIISLAWDKPLLWDSSVYIAMGKSMFSGSRYGFWEIFRPPMIPTLLGALWKLEVPMAGYTRLFSVFLSAAGLAVVYLLSERIHGRKEAALTSVFLASSYAYFYFSANPLTGIPSSILIFVALYLVTRGKNFQAGLAGGLAFLTRFPAAIVGPAMVIYVLAVNFDSRDWKEFVERSFYLTAGFFVIAAPYLVLNQYFFGDFLMPFRMGAAIPAGIGQQGFDLLFYLWKSVRGNPLMIFASLGIYEVLRKRDKNYAAFLFALVLFYGFFSSYPLRLERYMLPFLPLIALFAAKGITSLEQIFQKNLPVDFFRVAFIAGLLVLAASFMEVNDLHQWQNDDEKEFFSNIEGLEGTVASNDPRVNVYSDFSYQELPPDILDSVISKKGSEVDYWAINGCAWDCRGYGKDCEEDIASFESKLQDKYKEASKVLGARCNYTVYER